MTGKALNSYRPYVVTIWKSIRCLITLSLRLLVSHGRLVRRHNAHWSETWVRIALRKTSHDHKLILYPSSSSVSPVRRLVFSASETPDDCVCRSRDNLWRVHGVPVQLILPYPFTTFCSLWKQLLTSIFDLIENTGTYSSDARHSIIPFYSCACVPTQHLGLAPGTRHCFPDKSLRRIFLKHKSCFHSTTRRKCRILEPWCLTS